MAIKIPPEDIISSSRAIERGSWVPLNTESFHLSTINRTVFPQRTRTSARHRFDFCDLPWQLQHVFQLNSARIELLYKGGQEGICLSLFTVWQLLSFPFFFFHFNFDGERLTGFEELQMFAFADFASVVLQTLGVRLTDCPYMPSMLKFLLTFLFFLTGWGLLYDIGKGMTYIFVRSK